MKKEEQLELLRQIALEVGTLTRVVREGNTELTDEEQRALDTMLHYLSNMRAGTVERATDAIVDRMNAAGRTVVMTRCNYCAVQLPEREVVWTYAKTVEGDWDYQTELGLCKHCADGEGI